jgi:hypothetical protein
MRSIKYIYWKDEDIWIGYIEEFPDYMTQGKSKEELQENLIDLYNDLDTNQIPNVRRVAELQVP